MSFVIRLKSTAKRANRERNGQEKCLIDHRTKGFCSIMNFSFDFNRKHSNVDFETKLAKIRYELTEINQFQN